MYLTIKMNTFELFEIELGEAGKNSKEMYSYGPPHMAVQKQDDQH